AAGRPRSRMEARAAARSGGGDRLVDYPRAGKYGLRRWIPSFFQMATMCVIGFAAMLAMVGISYAMVDVPAPNELATGQTSVFYYADGKTELGRVGAQNRTSVDLSEIPDHTEQAVLAAENRTFYSDAGISPTGLARAVWVNFTGQSTQGGSTITQQYVKNMFLTQERTYTRKFKELFIAVKIDQRHSKAHILEDYLNTIYFGRGSYGIETASRAYFGKPASKLTVEESAVLASIIRSPGLYDPEESRGALVDRWHYVLDGMASMGWISGHEAQTAKFPKVSKYEAANDYEGPNGYLLQSAKDELQSRGFSEQEVELKGLRITTTFDKKVQHAANMAMKHGFPKKGAKDLHAGLAAIEPRTGRVMAVWGGRDYTEVQYNDATQARPQAGSTFKPFTLAAALEEDIGLQSRFKGNTPLKIPDDKPVHNEFEEDYGRYVTLMRATAESINTAFADLTMEIGPKAVVDSAIRAGIPKKTPGLEDNIRVTLGTASVTPLEMAQSYATLAAGGVRANTFMIDKVKGQTGATLFKAEPKSREVFDDDIMADVNFALQEVVKRGTGEAAKELERPAAGKTGTAEDKSAWFAGHTPQLAAAVAFYKGDGTESLDGVAGMETFFGGGYPAQIWTEFMKRALKGEPIEEFPPPAKLGETINPAPTPTVTPTPTETVPPTPTEEPESTFSPVPEPTYTAPDPTIVPPGGGGGGGGGGGDCSPWPLCSGGGGGRTETSSPSPSR
ncbi:MAG: transglycosylase domain-containing protein, partial [Streptomycetales bacterium]